MNFVERLDKALAEQIDGRSSYTLRHYLTKKAWYESVGRLEPGIYYWLPDKYLHWSVEPFWYSHYGSDISHPTIWNRYISEELAEGFDKKDRKEDIEDCIYALPRGRVVLNDHFNDGKHKTQKYKFILIHGDDSPGNLTKISVQFNVSLDENCIPIVSQHWTPMREDYERLCEILGVDLKLTFKSEFDGQEE